MKSLIVISAPSGAGKTTIAKRILAAHPDQLTFSISATTRPMRNGERDGVDYYFLSKEEFLHRIKENQLIEYEEIFGNFYGTLVSEIDRARAGGKSLIFDIDVKGGISIRARYPNDSLLIFIAPPSMEELYIRLMGRGSEDSETIDRRLARAEMEMEMKDVYDHIVVNDDLENAVKDVETLIFGR
ncbi:MAG: guanylate kinase [Bacteroidota bacterium]|nr:guanylate kinase [Bacteroidota bacterium]MDP4231347.1 guanylate kinase [Bacteroidota bacterium]MDP4236534.1 guanylate kinase [Bacteroidota bacterium]